MSEGDTRTRPVRYYLDCEFNGLDGELLSMALCREGGGGGYFVIEPTAIKGEIDPWVADNVVPVMGDCPASGQLVTPENLPHSIGRMFEAWGDPDPIIVTDWPDDIKYFCQAVITGPGTMIGVKSLRFEMHRVDAYPTTLAGAVQHNAWWDALALEHLLAPASPPAPTMAPTGAGSDSTAEAAHARHDARLEVSLQRSEADWDAIEDAIVTVISLAQSPGHTLTEADCAAITLVDKTHREDEESATDAFLRGEDIGRTEAAGADVAALLKKIDVLTMRLAGERSLTKFYRALASPPPPTRPDLEGVKEALRTIADPPEDVGLQELPGIARSALQALEAKNV